MIPITSSARGVSSLIVRALYGLLKNKLPNNRLDGYHCCSYSKKPFSGTFFSLVLIDIIIIRCKFLKKKKN